MVDDLIGAVDGFGPAGASATQIVDELVRRGVVTEDRARTTVWRYLPRAMDQAQGDLRIVQPGGFRTRYYTARYVHSRKAA